MSVPQELSNLFSNIRDSIIYGVSLTDNYESLLNFNKNTSQVYITLFQNGEKSIRWGSKKDSLSATINQIVKKLRENKSFKNFTVNDSSKCRILFEIVTKEYECNIRNLTTMRMNSQNRFEPGVNGLKYKYEGVTRFFMPTDGYTKSIMSVNQLLNYLSKQCGVSKKTDKISERVHLMRREPIEYSFIKSVAYISYQNEVLELERGYPLPVEFNKEILYDKTIKSIDWLVENMNDDGSFLYYYDPYLNTIVDDMHPNMLDPLYNNILRHSGGTISLLRGYELSKNELYLNKAKKSIEFLISTFRTHKYKKEFACYPFFNKKSKLGGAGIGLVALMHYYIHTRDECYRKEMDGLVRHILSRVDKDGEMIGYYIHPKFNDAKALINPSDEVKKELFSFYYPGEALLGLALYYLHVKNIDESLKEDIKIKSEMALDFLVDVRPVKYDYMFDSLPADAWLMQAIEEWVKVDGFKKKSYIDFVFNDTQTMFEHMYKDVNTLPENKDYIGGFFYDYGEHVYHDASRCEGVVSAYYLAKHLKDEEKADSIMEHMMLSAKGLMKTFHDEKSVYAHINQEKALNSFRFKLTRQWVRVDSVQHAACFFSRLYKTDFKIIHLKDSIDDFKIIKKLDEAGYSSVYHVQKDSKDLVLKDITQTRYINLIENENRFLKIMNDFNTLKFHYLKKSNDKLFFILDYAKDGNLKRHIKNNGTLDEKEAINFLNQMLDTLTFMKSKNILHLDIKPANILLYKNNYVLSDFGNAIEAETALSLHQKGNPIFIAPEFYYGFRNLKSEIYSIACSLYFTLTCKNIFGLRTKDTLEKKIYAHLYLEPDLSAIKSEKLRYILSRMLVKDYKKRIDIQDIKNILRTDKYKTVTTNKTEISDVDFTNKAELYKTFSDSDSSYAQNELAKIYIQQNEYKKAYDMFEKSAKHGYASAICNLALMHYNPAYDMVDYEKSFHILQTGSNQEHDKIQYFIGLFYETGVGCTKDIELAIDWYKKSAKNAYKKAFDKLKLYDVELDCNFD